AGGVDPRGSGRRHEPDVALGSFTSGTTGRARPGDAPPLPAGTLLGRVPRGCRTGVGVAGAWGPPARPGRVELRHSTLPTLMDGVLDGMGWTGRDPDRPPMPNLIPVSLSLWAGLYKFLFA